MLPGTSLRRAALPLAALLLPALGCGGRLNDLQGIPNKDPVADARVDVGGELLRVGYVVNGEPAQLDGSTSRDTDNGTIEVWHWSVVEAPQDSAWFVAEDEEPLPLTELPEDDPETDADERAYPTFTPDALGTFRLALVVEDDDGGVSEEAPLFVQSVPPSNLQVQIEWGETQPGADIDVHLIAPGGSYWTESDCFSWFPNPAWGSPELALDDPELLADNDGEGSGPYRETILLTEPPAGLYQIWVHYYFDHVQAADTTQHQPIGDVSLTVSVLGSPLGSPIVIPEPLQEGEIWMAAQLDWPDRVLTPLDLGFTDHTSQGGPDYNVEN